MIMSPQSHFDFSVRSILLLNIMLLRQLLRVYNLQIDVDTFLQCFSGDAGRLMLTTWPLGPDGSIDQQPDPMSTRELA